MSRIAALTRATAQPAAQDMLTELVARHGQAGSMVSTMAHSPAVLAGYLQLSKAMKHAKLSRRISEVVSIAVQARQGCQLCLDAHITAARTFGVTDAEIAAARQGTSPDPAVAAMITTRGRKEKQMLFPIYSPEFVRAEQEYRLEGFRRWSRHRVDTSGSAGVDHTPPQQKEHRRAVNPTHPAPRH